MVTLIYINIDSGNGLLPDSTKPLLEPMMTYHHYGPVTFILQQFYKWNPSLGLKFHSTPQGPMSVTFCELLKGWNSYCRKVSSRYSNILTWFKCWPTWFSGWADPNFIWGVIILLDPIFHFKAIEFGEAIVKYHYIYQNCSSSVWHIASCVSTSV